MALLESRRRFGVIIFASAPQRPSSAGGPPTLQHDDVIFEAICQKMEKALNRPLTPEERTAMRLAHAAVQPTPFVVERRADSSEPNVAGKDDAAKAAD